MDARKRLQEKLAAGVVLLDGGMGTLLIAQGLEPGAAPERWNVEHPDRVASAQRRYVEAGSDVILTNTFGATSLKLEASGLGGRCRELNAAAVELARACAPLLVLDDQITGVGCHDAETTGERGHLLHHLPALTPQSQIIQ